MRTHRLLDSKNPFRYKDYYFDTNTGLYYPQSRYNNAYMGRFINANCIVDTQDWANSANMIAYCANNPVNISDSNGMWWTTNSTAYYAFYAALGSAALAIAITNANIASKNLSYNSQSKFTIPDHTINGQTNEPWANMHCSTNGTISANGCGLIAVYNYMFSKKGYKGKNLKNIIYEFDLNAAYTLVYSAAFGVNPAMFDYYFSAHGVKSTTKWGLNTNSLNALAKAGGWYILTYWNDARNHYGKGAHYVLVQYDGKTYYAYNYWSNGTAPKKDAKSLSDVIGIGALICVTVVG